MYIGNNTNSKTIINNYYGSPGMGGPMGMGPKPQMPQMMQMMMKMMMQMMQMMMGGQTGPCMGGQFHGMMPSMGGGMPGMGGGMPPCGGGFSPNMCNNMGNFLGMPPAMSAPPTGGSPAAPLQTSGTPAFALPASNTAAPATPAASPAAPAPQKQPANTGAAPNSPGKTKTGPPPGYKRMTGKIPSAVVSKAQSLLSQPMGKEIPFEINGKRYMARLETHYHPPGYKGGPNGYHKGVTVYEQA